MSGRSLSRNTLFQRHPLLYIGTGFLFIVVTMATMVVFGLSRLETMRDELDTVINKQNVKIDLVQGMRHIVRERMIAMYQLGAEEDTFKRDEVAQRFIDMANQFIRLRASLEELGLTSEESQLFAELKDLTVVASPVHDRVVELLSQNKLWEGRALLKEKSIPAQLKVMEQCDRILVYYRKASENIVMAAHQSHERAAFMLRLMAGLVGSISLVTGFVVLKRVKTDSEAVQEAHNSLETKVAERTAELQVANQELEAFAYTVSHDLRAPLRSINGFSQILLEDYGDQFNEDGRTYLQRLHVNAVQMGKIIDALLQLSRVTRAELTREPVNLTLRAKGIAARLADSDPSRQVDFQIAPGMSAQGDPALLQVMLENLISNAWKYSSKADHPRIEIGMTQLDDEPCFFVRDNGAGFDMAKAENLFKPFQRLHKDSEFEGIGIGLATVQRIVNRHGGWIRAESAPNQGTTFYFTLST